MSVPGKKDPSVALLERELRNLRRNIVGIVEAGRSAGADDDSFAYFESRYEAATDYWQRFQEVWRDLDRAHYAADPDFEFPDKTWEEFFNLARDEMWHAGGKIRALKLERERLAVAGTTANSPPAATANGYLPTSLPRISIPKFDGDLFKWTHFRDTFISLVHSSKCIPPIDKMHHLREALVGEPAALLAGLPYDGASYTQAWAALMREYDNPRVLATRHLQKILGFKMPQNGSEYSKYQHFMAQVAENIDCFRALKLEDSSDVILSTLSLRALDSATRRQFELSHSNDDFPSTDDVINFVRQRMMAYKLSAELQDDHSAETTRPSSQRPKPPLRDSVRYSAPAMVATTHRSRSPPQNRLLTCEGSPRAFRNTYRRAPKQNEGSPRNSPPRREPNPPCAYCQEPHPLARCFDFAQLPVEQRTQFARAWTGCLNCLGRGHKTTQCSSRWRCRFCGAAHNSLLHTKDMTNVPSPDSNAPNPTTSTSFAGHAREGTTPLPISNSEPPSSQIVMGTAQTLLDGSSHVVPARALLDTGSQYTFITSTMARSLGGRIQPFDGRITGLGGNTVSAIRGWLVFRLRSTVSASQFKVRALVVDQITSDTPQRPLPNEAVSKLLVSPLADPSFADPGPIDVLIGASLFPHLLSGAPIQSGIDGLFLIPTVLGHVVMGSVPSTISAYGLSLVLQDSIAIVQQLEKFWEIEEPVSADLRNPLDVASEQFFKKTCVRTSEGRYMVRLPLKTSESHPSDNRELAMRRFYSIERKFSRDPALKSKYIEFMQEYLDLGHMAPATQGSRYVIPHHGVWQIKPGGSKLRVVFDASCSAGSSSLNDVLEAGPKLQTDLQDVLVRFRLYPIALTTDIVKMYRQILVHPSDRSLQHIFWREEPSMPLQEYELCTVTYGVKSSAYQAIRVVHQLLEDEGSHFPLAAKHARESFYVDDFASGANSFEEALELQNQLIQLFRRGGFELSKWASNDPRLIPDYSRVQVTHAVHQDPDHYLKILGLIWHPQQDVFSFSINTPSPLATKRNILSSISRIFDPLGFLAPVILYAKSLMQETWRCDVSWDDPLPSSIGKRWSALMEQWPMLESVHIPRYIRAFQTSLQLIGFCDASTRGYAAAVYVRSIDPQVGGTRTFLLKAKTRVAPTKFLSVAQLELCGALLLQRVMNSINLHSQREPLYFTDSSVVLAWIHIPAHQLKVFEANRVSEILKFSRPEQWHHCRSEINAADIASRGCLPSDLLDHNLWWHGPSFIQEDAHELSSHSGISREDEIGQALLAASERWEPCEDSWINRFSSLQKLVRVVAYCIRFSLRARKTYDSAFGPISAPEFEGSLLSCIRITQRAAFPHELYGNTVPKVYQQLQPFVDEQGLVRVGGRLKRSELSYDHKHPLLLPYGHHLSQLIVDDLHVRHFHAGPNLMLSLLRGRFWIPRALKFLKSRLHRCVKCRILRARPAIPVMGDLPSQRFDQLGAFNRVGLDFAGPFVIRESLRRKASLSKAYLCIFVCLATKAVHLELVSALTTEAFLAALERFIARRGLPSMIHSDNATNFVGASRYLKDLFTFVQSHSEVWINHLSPKGIDWRFIPPRSPHFGGLWEAGVKSVKGLMTNTIGKHPFTFEELCTILIRIEGLLNSRPLCPLNEDPESFDTLTPGHFLICRPLAALPDAQEPDVRTPTARWPLVQHQMAVVWSKWRRDYLHQLQKRTRWTQEHPNLAVGDLVVLIEDRVPAGTWPVGRVTEVFPGQDSKGRVVCVRTPSGKNFKRSVAKLAPLLAPEPTHPVQEA